MAKPPKQLTDEDIAACQPEAIWLEKKKSPIPAHTTYWVLFTLLIAALTWAYFAKIDVVIVAEGKLVNLRPNIVLKPLERTVVKQVNVQTGQRVNEGDILITFDPTLNRAEQQRLQTQLESFHCQQIRLKAQLEGKASYTLPPALTRSPYANQQQAIFETQNSYLKEKLHYFNENITRYELGSKSIEQNLKNYEERLRSMAQIEEMYRQLTEKKLTSLRELLDVRISRLAMDVEVEKQRSTGIEYKQQILALKAEKNAFISEWDKNLLDELVAVELEMNDLEQSLKKTAMLDSMVEMRAPCDAVVHEIAPFQEGSAVREAEPLITLIPLNEELEAEVMVDSKDIGNIAIGMPAKVKMDAFPFQKHGTKEGSVRYISFDANEQQAQQQASSEGRPPAAARFMVRLTLNGKLKHVPQGFTETAGMRLRCEIKRGERTVLSYLINPLTKALDEAMRE